MKQFSACRRANCVHALPKAKADGLNGPHRSRGRLALGLPQHADEHRPEGPVGPLEVGEHKDVEQFDAGSRPEGVQALTESAL